MPFISQVLFNSFASDLSPYWESMRNSIIFSNNFLAQADPDWYEPSLSRCLESSSGWTVLSLLVGAIIGAMIGVRSIFRNFENKQLPRTRNAGLFTNESAVSLDLSRLREENSSLKQTVIELESQIGFLNKKIADTVPLHEELKRKIKFLNKELQQAESERKTLQERLQEKPEIISNTEG